MIKLWGGSGKKAIKNERKKRKVEVENSIQKKDILEVLEESTTSRNTNNIIDFETLTKMHNEHRASQYETLAVVGNETVQTVYTEKQRSLKFLTL